MKHATKSGLTFAQMWEQSSKATRDVYLRDRTHSFNNERCTAKKEED